MAVSVAKIHDKRVVQQGDVMHPAFHLQRALNRISASSSRLALITCVGCHILSRLYHSSGEQSGCSQEFQAGRNMALARHRRARCGVAACVAEPEPMNEKTRTDNSVVDEVTRLLEAAGRGASSESGALLPLVYEELRKLAASRMHAERADHTLQATALVHEAFLRLVGNSEQGWANRAHFFAAAGEAMRRILIEHARARQGPKRGGGRQKLPLDVVDLAKDDDPDQILALDDAISRLEEQDPESARVVRLRFYAGLSVEETASALGLSPRTVKREWAFARAFLVRELKEE
jgi:RNA polymerase sigma factor (TIGR02999 family)